MKILESYLGIAESLFIEAEIDDEEMIKYKDKDGESKEMKAGSAKTMDKEHPAKIEYDRMADKGDDKEEPKGKALGKGDFERPGEEPSGEPEGDDDITTGDVDKVFKQVEHGISDDEWNKVPPKVKKAFRSKVTKIYSTMKKLDDNREYDKLEKMEEKFGLQLWQAKGLYDDFVEGDAGPEFDEPEDAEKRMAQIDKERESLSRQYNRLDQPGADKSGEGKAKVMKKWDALDAEYDELEKSVGDEPEGGKDESITINGQKYRPIKESKQRTFKEIYDRTFRSLK